MQLITSWLLSQTHTEIGILDQPSCIYVLLNYSADEDYET